MVDKYSPTSARYIRRQGVRSTAVVTYSPTYDPSSETRGVKQISSATSTTDERFLEERGLGHPQTQAKTPDGSSSQDHKVQKLTALRSESDKTR